MGARRNHYYYIDRYPLGLDATVFMSGSGSVQSMSFTNDTTYPVLIRGYQHQATAASGYVRFDIYSVPTGRKVDVHQADRQEHPAGDATRSSTLDACRPAQRSGSSARSTARTSGSPGPSTTRTAGHPPDDLLLALRADHRRDPDRQG